MVEKYFFYFEVIESQKSPLFVVILVRQILLQGGEWVEGSLDNPLHYSYKNYTIIFHLYR